MQAGQHLIDSNGYEVMLFPLDVMFITQGEGGPLSHILAMDFVGWNGQQQILNYSYYAPCTCRCVAKNITQAWSVFESIRPVHLADDTVRIVTFVVMHDNNILYNIGDIVQQGQILGHTGDAGIATGDHMHFNTAFGPYQGWTTEYQFNELLNSSHIYDTCFINDTTLYEDFGYSWKNYTGKEKNINTWKKWYLLKKAKRG